MKAYPFSRISASVTSLGWAWSMAFNEESFLPERRSLRPEVRVQRFSFPMLESSLPRVTYGLNQHGWYIGKYIAGSNLTPKSSKLYFSVFIFQRLGRLQTNWLSREFIAQTRNLAHVMCNSSSPKPCGILKFCFSFQIIGSNVKSIGQKSLLPVFCFENWYRKSQTRF